jgi:hypothetical protein
VDAARLTRWAEQTGTKTAGVIAYIFGRRIHPQHGYRACLGILCLGKQHVEEWLEATCQRGLALGSCSYKSLESIPRQGLERLSLGQQNLSLLLEEQINLHGTGYRPEKETRTCYIPPLDKLRTLRLHGMIKALGAQHSTPDINDLGFDERLGLMVGCELTEREDARMTTRLKAARLRHNACLEDIDYSAPRSQDMVCT